MLSLKDIPFLPPYCPNCHKSFFTAEPASSKQTKTCHCKLGKRLVADWILQAKVMNQLSDPLEALEEPTNEPISDPTKNTEHLSEELENV